MCRWPFVCAVDVVEAGMLERVDIAATSNASARQQRELRNAAAALVLQLLSAPLLPNASAMVRATHVCLQIRRPIHTPRQSLAMWAQAQLPNCALRSARLGRGE